MAKKAKDVSNQLQGYDPGLVQGLLKRLEGCAAELLSERGSYMKKCRDLRETMAGIYEEATARGVPGKALKKLFKAQEALAKVTADIEELEDEAREAVLGIAQAGEVKPVLDLFGFAAGTPDANVVDLNAKRTRKRKAAEPNATAPADAEAAPTLN